MKVILETDDITVLLYDCDNEETIIYVVSNKTLNVIKTFTVDEFLKELTK